MTNNQLPTWLTEDSDYQVKKGNSRFIDKSTKSVAKIISAFRHNSFAYSKSNNNPVVNLLAMFVLIVLTAVSKNFAFAMLMVAVTLVLIAIMPSIQVAKLIKSVIPAVIFAFIIMIPSFFIGSPRTLIIICTKVFVCTSLVARLTLIIPYNKITNGLKSFFIPDIIIFTLDLTIKYIAILGDICYEMLQALKIRQIGKSNNSSSFSGILGNVFIKSKDAAINTNNAMMCRGFSGSYAKSKSKKLSKFDLLTIVVCLILIGFFVYFEVIL